MAGKQNDIASGSRAPARPGDPIDLESSVAGEEDPGASIELANVRNIGAQPPMAPGDEAPAGTPSTGENVCPQCGGSGRLGASACPNCEGTGKVIVGIGGA
ncbi:MAG: hypothetical protein EOO30_01295 [Comamonadaceae bacterium]|nr:MAG: hypothetical protein EOO30_01295 [Comamonadaceae bacterium]